MVEEKKGGDEMVMWEKLREKKEKYKNWRKKRDVVLIMSWVCTEQKKCKSIEW